VKVAFLASRYAPYGGGAEMVVQNQAEGFAAAGHRAHVLTLGEPASAPARAELHGVDVVRVPLANLYLPGSGQPGTLRRMAWHARDVSNGQMARAAQHWLAELQPDVVVCHNVYGWSASVWPAIRSLGLPTVQVLHDQYLRCIRSSRFRARPCEGACASCRLLRLPHRSLSRVPDAVVGVSRYVLDSFVEDGYFLGVPLRTHIHNASHLDTRSRPTPPLTGANIVFGFIGALTPIKGIESLLEAFRATARPGWLLRVAGSGDPGFVEQLRRRHAGPGIEFVGRQDPATFYLGLDATVVPSLWNDTLPSVVFESLIHGRPVIGTRRGGIPEMVDDGVNGLLYDPDEPAALGAALASFAASVEQWRTRQAAIKACAAPLYCDRDAWIARWESLLRSVLDRGRTAR
jgi:glycosyltransferase involved in cell wall biosynthesis